MNVTQIVDQILARDDNVSETAAHNETRRQRILELLREVHAETWWARDWTFKKREASVVVPVGQGTASLPWNFASLGNYGGVYFPIGSQGDGTRLEYVPESVITDLRAGAWQDSTPKVFSIFGQDEAFIPQIQLPPTGGQYTLSVIYQPNPAYIDEVVGLPAATDIAMTAVSGRTGTLTSVLTDFTTQFLDADAVRISGFLNAANNGEFEIVGTVTANSMPVQKRSADTLVNEIAGPSVTLEGHINDIKEVPEKYHQMVLVPGVKSKTRESKGDQRWQAMVAIYQKAIMWMKQEEGRFQSEFRQLPSFFGRHGY